MLTCYKMKLKCFAYQKYLIKTQFINSTPIVVSSLRIAILNLLFRKNIFMECNLRVTILLVFTSCFFWEFIKPQDWQSFTWSHLELKNYLLLHVKIVIVDSQKRIILKNSSKFHIHCLGQKSLFERYLKILCSSGAAYIGKSL